MITFDDARRALRRLGPVDWIAILLIVTAVAIQVAVVLPLRLERDALRVEAATPASAATLQAPVAQGPAAQVRAFESELPPATDLPRYLARINQAAAANGIVLRSGEYRLEHPGEARFSRYRMTLAVRGSYAQIRGFIGAVLTGVATAAVDDVQLKRDNTAGSALDARVHLSLFIAGAPTP